MSALLFIIFLAFVVLGLLFMRRADYIAMYGSRARADSDGILCIGCAAFCGLLATITLIWWLLI